MTNYTSYPRRAIKKQQKRITSAIRDMNTNIKNDDLWRGRFVAKQVSRYVDVYSDGSGVCITPVIEFYDRKTMQKATTMENYILDVNFRNSLYWKMNDFITEYIKVWENEDRKVLYSDTTDYSTIPIDTVQYQDCKRNGRLNGFVW